MDRRPPGRLGGADLFAAEQAGKSLSQSGRYSASQLAQPNLSASRNAQTSSHISMGWGECPSSIIIVIVLNSRARSWSSCGIALVRASFSIRSSDIAWRRGGWPGPGSRIRPRGSGGRAPWPGPGGDPESRAYSPASPAHFLCRF